MKRNQIVNGTITISISFKDTFPEDWDDDQIEEFIEKNYKQYIDNDDNMEYDGMNISNIEIDYYGGDDVYGI